MEEKIKKEKKKKFIDLSKNRTEETYDKNLEEEFIQLQKKTEEIKLKEKKKSLKGKNSKIGKEIIKYLNKENIIEKEFEQKKYKIKRNKNEEIVELNEKRMKPFLNIEEYNLNNEILLLKNYFINKKKKRKMEIVYDPDINIFDDVPEYICDYKKIKK
jgi:hypothetical protein